MPNCLYISDLDGTLLTPDAKLTDTTVRLINRFIDNGGAFTVASARNITGLRVLDLSAVHWQLPFVLAGGVMLYDYAEKRILDVKSLSPATVKTVLELCEAHGKSPMLFQVKQHEIRITTRGATSFGERSYIKERNRLFHNAVEIVEQYDWKQGAFCFSMQDSEQRLRPLCEQLDAFPEIRYTFYPDTYLPDNWFLEISRADAGKGNAVREYKQRFQFQRVVAFGDNLNDMEMLRMADTACVVANGTSDVKRIAQEIIGSNTEDGVAWYVNEKGEISC